MPTYLEKHVAQGDKGTDNE